MTEVVFSYAVPGQQPSFVIREHDDGKMTMTVRTRLVDADGDATLATIDIPWPAIWDMIAALHITAMDWTPSEEQREAARALCQRAQELKWPPDTD